MHPCSCNRRSVVALLENNLVDVHHQATRLRATDPIANRFIYTEHETKDWSVKGILHRTLYRPFYMLANEPILMLVTAFLSLENGILYGREHFTLCMSVYVTILYFFSLRSHTRHLHRQTKFFWFNFLWYWYRYIHQSNIKYLP